MDYTSLLDIGLGGLAIALYRKLSVLVDLLKTQIADHENRITQLETHITKPVSLVPTRIGLVKPE